MRPDVEDLRQQWEGILEDFEEAEKEARYANAILDEVRRTKDAFVGRVLFGI